ncbi:hypothetical protein SERLA73DRAFT_142345 [Serpula lacrymans var. lacrymans S7.3]|uniref:Uncharacterized protein n=2 Tax=Serpula lacrymans var. lacrymans TaxID=341189 RepID=F8Q7M4_SERL3|nr:uncharacterized protein SERLADRAFT_398379 [Serpula lacrymans var. lacrymans S7.9]EGN95562.1 hypothetical protein SERLA73DRAFT_142345 [Serpula lacrymans var. lacrymans S7.3]EGO21090.1 hypothetical protein SERLADRAFT_398379 [Serpula lacrymans var. lacrymans S7.9]
MHEDFDCNQGEDIFDEQCYFEDNCVVDQPFLDEYQDDLQVNEYQPAIIENMDSYSSHDYAARPSSSCSSLQSRNTHDTVTSGGHRFFQGRALLLGISAYRKTLEGPLATTEVLIGSVKLSREGS